MTRLRPVVVVHYHEISLKRGNRPLFLRHLARNLRNATADLGPLVLRQRPGRIVLDLDDHPQPEAVRDRVLRVCGVASASLGYRTSATLDAMKSVIGRLVEGRQFASFRISARRAFKTYPMSSVELNRALGAFVLERVPTTRVSLERFEVEIVVEVLPDEAFVSLDRQSGPGGLPVGAGGTVAALLSGGIDSPVAAWRMMKRGCRVVFVHFHSVPYLPPTSQAKARALVERLTGWQYASRLYLVPFGEIQREVVLSVPPPARVVVYRRLMIRIAEEIAPAQRRAGPGHRREPGAGGLADAGEHRVHRRGRAGARASSADRHGQARDHRAGQAARDLRDLDRARRGLLHAVHAEASLHADDGGRGQGGGVSPGRAAAGRRGRRRRDAGELRVPGAVGPPDRLPSAERPQPQHVAVLTWTATIGMVSTWCGDWPMSDPEVAKVLREEAQRQHRNLELIASENFVSEAVLEATGSVLTNKYAEGYPGRRYYGGCEVVDVVEDLAIARAKELFGAEHVNVQPHSGAQANMAVYFTLLKPGDVVLGPNLSHGGHLTAGSPVNYSGKFYSIVAYGVRRDTERIDLDQVRDLAKEHRPKLLIAGGSAFPRTIDFQPFADIAREVGATLMADIAHPAGLVAAGSASLADRAGRLRHHHHAQDAARPAGRHGDVPREPRLPRSTRP